MHYLLLKIHRVTKLKYLCWTTRKDPKAYLGSGLVWTKHLKKYGNNFKTIILFVSTDIDEISKIGLFYSKWWNIIKNHNFANLIDEDCKAGGSVTHLYKWINDGKNNRYVFKNLETPDGWVNGRICNFNDPIFQKEMNRRAQLKIPADVRIRVAKEMGLANKGRKNPMISGLNNPACRPEVKAKIQLAAKNRIKIECEYCKKMISKQMFNRWHGIKCKENNELTSKI